jgi:two-component system OmpR family response regulator
VIEDHPSIRRLIAVALVASGYAVETASNGADGLVKLGCCRFDAILLDLNMPVMDGWEFLNATAGVPHCSDIPIIVISAAVQTHAVPDDPRVQRHLEKPFDLDELLAVVRSTLNDQRSE